MRVLFALVVLALLALIVSGNVHVSVNVESGSHHGRRHHREHSPMVEEHEEHSIAPEADNESPAEHTIVKPLTKIVSESEVDEASAATPSSSLTNVPQQLAKWMKKYNKKWSGPELTKRTQIFSANLHAAVQHNHQAVRPFDMALNAQSDRTPQEIRSVNGLKLEGADLEFLKKHAPEAEIDEAEVDSAEDDAEYPPRAVDFDPITLTGGIAAPARPSSGYQASRGVDWRTQGKVVAVRDQETCGSCWAFSGSDSFASAVAIKTNSKPQLFAPQYLVDCDTKLDPLMHQECPECQPNKGCGGGLPHILFSWLRVNNHVYERDYRYANRQHACNKNAKKSPYHTEVKQGFEIGAGVNQMKSIIAKGPAVVAVDAESSAFQMYRGGILDSASCGTSLDHAVTLVGYGSEAGIPYWIIKNSWTEQWGERGFIRIRMGKNMCGVETMIVRPVV